MFENKVALVTGGCGFIGSHLVEKLLQQGMKKVIAFDNFMAGKRENINHLKENKHFELIAGDVRDYDVISPLVAESDFVFHLAASKLVVALKRPRIDLETNIIGTFNILQAAKENGARVIHASTGSTLGSSEHPMPEDFPPNPTTLYGISKLTAERYCIFYAREFGIRVSVIRYFHVFGPRQDYSGEAGVINIFLSRILCGNPPIIYGTGEQIRCFTFVMDSVDATLLTASKDETIGEIYNVASKNRVSVKELAEIEIRKYAKNDMKAEFGPPRQGENLKPIPDTSKIEKLGFQEKVSFIEGLELCKRWIESDMRVKGLLR